jgi:L-alanine-DL-glutamate epimerase-like enolase superfamily enzyme
VRVSIDVLEARLRAPVVTAWGSIEVRPLVLLRFEDADGVVGYGEAAPLPGYDGVSVDDVVRTLERGGGEGPPQALAAIDMARLDLEGRRSGRPGWELLGAPGAPPVEVNALVDGVSAAIAATAAGFRCLKVKVGLGEDVGRLAGIREAVGTDVAIRIDANGAWSVTEALASLEALEPIGIELCEEPVSGIDGIARVAAGSAVPVALDETPFPDERVCTAVCLKLSRCGGISRVIEAAARARASGYEVYLASTFDGPLGIAAALHAAAVIQPDRPSGLATLELFERGSTVRGGRMTAPAGPGLGDGLSGWYRRR